MYYVIVIKDSGTRVLEIEAESPPLAAAEARRQFWQYKGIIVFETPPVYESVITMTEPRDNP